MGRSFVVPHTSGTSGSFARLDTELTNMPDPDLFAYLQYEAERRSITIQDAYREEMDAEKRACELALSQEELEVLAREGKPDPRYLSAKEKYPF
jgi:hypothetical protein